MPVQHENPPGRPALGYRLGTHQSFLRGLLGRLHAQTVPGADPQAPALRPLAALTTRDPSNPMIALLDAWAMVEDVIGFYQERIANEGYLRTALEERSILELTRLIGYAPRPGLAASTSLAFTVAVAPGMDPVVQLAPGIQVQSIPGQDQQPQVFETVEAIAARPEWNRIPLALAADLPPEPIARRAESLRLDGVRTGLRAGDRLLIVEGPRMHVPLLRSVEQDPEAQVTVVGWGAPLDPQADEPTTLERPQVFSFRRAAGLFPAAPQRWTTGGLFRAEPGGALERVASGQPAQPILCLAACDDGARDLLFAGTAGAGVLRSTDSGATWQPCSAGLATLTITAICACVIGGRLAIYAGGVDGSIAVSLDSGASWSSTAAAAYVEREVAAYYVVGVTPPDREGLGQAKAPLEPLNDPEQLKEVARPDKIAVVGQGLLRAAVRGLAVREHNGAVTLLAATDAGLFSSADAGTWEIVETGQFWAVAVTASGGLWIGQGDQVRPEAGALATPVAGAYALALDGQGRPVVATAGGIARVVDGGKRPLGGPGTAVTALAVDRAGRVYAAALPAEHRAWPGEAFPEAQVLLDLDDDYGSDVGEWIVLGGPAGMAPHRPQGATSVVRQSGDGSVTVTRLALGPGLRETLPAGTTALIGCTPLATAAGPLTGDTLPLAATATQLPLGRRIIVAGRRGGAPARDPAAAVAEVAFTAGADERGHMRLTAPLQHSYERASAVVYANVALATHGETVQAEVLGSGDGLRANQRFTLRHQPLTYLPATSDSGDRAALTVQVNDLLWSEAPSLNELSADSQSYAVHRESDGRVRIIFGDGIHGARLPGGVENIVATYRYGLGPAGAVNAGSLTLLQTRPLGVQEVTNPLPATGAAAPEGGAAARVNAPLAALTLNRIVALADYERFARSFAGIGAAQTDQIWAGAAPLLHISLAGTEGRTIDPGSVLFDNLREAMDQRRNRRQPLLLASYRPLPFNIVATVFVAPRYRPELVRAAVERALRDGFAFQRRGLSVPVYTSTVLALIQGVAGVVAVDLDQLYLAGQTPARAPLLVARRARWDGEAHAAQALPAEMLVLNDVRIDARIAP